MAMYHEWQIEHYDLHAFVKQSVENFMIAFGDGKPIQDHRMINFIRGGSDILVPHTGAVDNSASVAKRQAIEAQTAKEITPVKWSLY